mgnify:CR=1 FL=1
MKFRLVAAFALVLGLVACGGSGDGGDDDGADIDAPMGTIDAATSIDAPASTNSLGTVCDLQMQNCPSGNSCTAVQGVGSQTMGWCSPMCMNMNAICSTGYTGPAGGMPVCALTTMQGQPPSLCAIICTGNTQCPTGLTCQMVPGQQQPVSICAPPA